MQCSIFNLLFQIAIYMLITTATMLFLQFNCVVILRWYSKKQDPRSCPGTIAVKDWAILARHLQIWHKACRWSFDFKLLKFSALFILILHAGLCWLGSKNFRNSSYKEKMLFLYLSVSLKLTNSSLNSTALHNMTFFYQFQFTFHRFIENDQLCVKHGTKYIVNNFTEFQEQPYTF